MRKLGNTPGMLLVLPAFAAVALCTILAAPAFGQGGQPGTTATVYCGPPPHPDVVFFYMAPETATREAGAVPCGQQITILGESVNGYYPIQTADGKRGYLSTVFVSAPKAAQAGPPIVRQAETKPRSVEEGQLPSSIASRQAVASQALALLQPFPVCEPAVELVKPVVPYLDKVDASESDQQFWTAVQKIYPAIWDVVTPCLRTVSSTPTAGAGRATAGVLTLMVLLSDLRGNVLALAVKQKTEEETRLRNNVAEYAKEVQRYFDDQQRHVRELERYARQVQQQEARSRQQQNFVNALLLLRALSPPAAPRAYAPPPGPLVPRFNLGVDCTIEPTITGQTFVHCY
jgi:Bacterial SH3 domain